MIDDNNADTPNEIKADKKYTRLAIVETVHAKSMHVKSEKECGRQYGSNNKTKLLKWKVLYFEMLREEGWQEQLKILSEYDLCGGMKKEIKLN